MKKTTIIICCFACLLIIEMSPSLSFAQQNPVSYVNPFIGSGIRHGAKRGWGYGQTYPGAVVPWGMVSVSPTTDLTSPSGYIHGNKWLYGFGQAHLSGTGCADFGSVLLMPTAGAIQTKLKEYRSEYGQEKASPGFYQTTLHPSGINAQMTATIRTGISKYTFPAGSGAHNILLNASFTLSRAMMPTLGHIKIDSPTQMEGWTQSGDFCSGNPFPRQTQKIYFVARFSAPADSMGTWNGNGPGSKKSRFGRHAGAFFQYKGGKKQTVFVKVGISYVSIADARRNLEAEQPGWDFNQIKKQAREKWNNQLSKIKVEGGTHRQKVIFYTGLYHMLLEPNVFNDVNGDYLVMGHNGVAKAKNYTRYSVYSLWDVYRNEVPFLTLFYPARQQDMVKTMLGMYKENGWLPKWSLASGESFVMVGDPGVAAVAETWLNGLHTFNKNMAYRAMTHDAMDTSTFNPIRPGLKPYLKYHYIPVHSRGVKNGAASITLEDNFADYALARFDSSIGRTKDAAKLFKRSQYYKNLYNKATGFLQAKTADGQWYTYKKQPFDPTQMAPGNRGGYVEGSAWNYLFFVPQDPHGLAKLMGGPEQYVRRLQKSISKGYFGMWNEPDMAYPYLFTYFKGASWRTQKAVRQTMQRAYTTDPGGLPGNDDCGVTSSWYVFSALGFYPADPASGNFRLGSPIFTKVTIQLNPHYYKGKTFTIEAPDASSENIYVQSVTLNGKPYHKAFITHRDIEQGGTLVLNMGPKPNKK
jgi:predicted alpha-1,2-mannosidase